MNLKSLVGSALACFALGTLLVPAKAAAEHTRAEISVNVVEDQLASTGALVTRAGYSLNDETRFATLYPQQSGGQSLYLLQGISYVITATCDQFCYDLDLSLYDSYGNIVASDYSVGKVAQLQLSPDWDEHYYLQVDMPDCRNPQGCLYGSDVYFLSNAW